MTYYITKYALTTGIQSHDDGKVKQCSEGMISVNERYTTYFHGEGKEWHRSKGAAVARADEMRRNKIASLKKSLAKIEKINFCENQI